MPDEKLPEDKKRKDTTPTSAEWLTRVKDELDELRDAVEKIELPPEETPLVRNTVEGISVALRAVHRQRADLEKLLAELAEQKE